MKTGVDLGHFCCIDLAKRCAVRCVMSVVRCEIRVMHSSPCANLAQLLASETRTSHFALRQDMPSSHVVALHTGSQAIRDAVPQVSHYAPTARERYHEVNIMYHMLPRICLINTAYKVCIFTPSPLSLHSPSYHTTRTSSYHSCTGLLILDTPFVLLSGSTLCIA